MNIGKSVVISGWPRIRTENPRSIKIGDGARIESDVVLWTASGGTIHIGPGAYIGIGTIINSNSMQGGITIGERALVGAYCLLQDSNHGISPDVPISLQHSSSAPIFIGSDSWLGANVCILKGVNIGAGAVVGANATVTRSIDANCIATGSPARLKRVR